VLSAGKVPYAADLTENTFSPTTTATRPPTNSIKKDKYRDDIMELSSVYRSGAPLLSIGFSAFTTVGSLTTQALDINSKSTNELEVIECKTSLSVGASLNVLME
jgi:hypothetical protein